MNRLFSNPSFPIICSSYFDQESILTNSLNDSSILKENQFKNANELYNYYFGSKEQKDKK